MQSIKELFRIGTGPSSSHTMGPKKASEIFLQRYPNALSYRVTLYSSLAATGKGHLTDVAIDSVIGDKLEIVWKPETTLPKHPNGMTFEAIASDRSVTAEWTVYSVGGGALLDGDKVDEAQSIYPLATMETILDYCKESGKAFWEYVEENEGHDIWKFLEEVWHTMSSAIDRGIDTEGTLPGGLGVSRKAHSFHRKAQLFSQQLSQNGTLASYAYAVAEENASGGLIVTAPTCGACGVLPAVIRYLEKTMELSRLEVLRALATAGLIGNLIKTNASISGAEVGCQGEIGSACSMAAAAATQLMGGSIGQIEYSAEMGIEHLLGLTCDPVGGLVQIPCIERNAHAAVRALGCSHFALLSDGVHKISFDDVMAVMMETGQAIPPMYRETSEAGLADKYRNKG
ncbi:MAG: L-serine ammonia-lyase [Denitrovibrio sp.]|nr:MAG: L-serine ammonia-lyase [Denitrovibrio sp.]